MDLNRYQYRGTISVMAAFQGSATMIDLSDLWNEDQPPIRLSVAGPLGKYIHEIEWTDAEERYISSDWIYDRGLYLCRIEVPSRDPNRPAKIIVQSDVRDKAVIIFGPQDYIETDAPEPMDDDSYRAWFAYRREHPERLRGQASTKKGGT